VSGVQNLEDDVEYAYGAVFSRVWAAGIYGFCNKSWCKTSDVLDVGDEGLMGNSG